MDIHYIHIVIEKYLNGTASKIEIEVVDRWLTLLDNEQNWNELSIEKLDSVKKEIWSKLNVSMRTEQNSTFKTSLTLKSNQKAKLISSNIFIKVAAIFLLVTATYFIYTIITKPFSNFDNHLQTLVVNGWNSKINDSKNNDSIILEDGTKITLTPQASIYYPTHFETTKREVRIKGSAFFSVAKDKNRPFFVFSKSIVTRVLGTSFWVKDEENKEASQVEVKSGAVAVFLNNNEDKIASSALKGVLLKPNEKAVFNRKEERFTTEIVDNPEPVTADSVDGIKAYNGPQIKYQFSDTKLSEIIKGLQLEYGITIILENEELGNLTFTGDISGFSYFDKIKIICKSLRINYEIKENRLLIKK